MDDPGCAVIDNGHSDKQVPVAAMIMRGAWLAQNLSHAPSLHSGTVVALCRTGIIAP